MVKHEKSTGWSAALIAIVMLALGAGFFQDDLHVVAHFGRASRCGLLVVGTGTSGGDCPRWISGCERRPGDGDRARFRRPGALCFVQVWARGSLARDNTPVSSTRPKDTPISCDHEPRLVTEVSGQLGERERPPRGCVSRTKPDDAPIIARSVKPWRPARGRCLSERTWTTHAGHGFRSFTLQRASSRGVSARAFFP